MRWWTILLAGLAALAPRAAGAAGDDPVVGWLLPLDGYPLCEASAALVVPCSTDPGRSCVWIADNEDAGELFDALAAQPAEGLSHRRKAGDVGIEDDALLALAPAQQGAPGVLQQTGCNGTRQIAAQNGNQVFHRLGTIVAQRP